MSLGSMRKQAGQVGMVCVIVLLALGHPTDAHANRAPSITLGPSFTVTQLAATGLSTSTVVETDTMETFDAAATDPDGDLLTYTWDFGDGLQATGSTVMHRYGLSGTYPVTVTVSDGNGGTDTKSISIDVVALAERDRSITTIPTGWAVGPKKVLMLQVNFQDSPNAVPMDPAFAAATANELGRWYRQESYGKTTWTVDVTKPLTLPLRAGAYQAMGDTGSYVGVLRDARIAARAAGYDVDAYDQDIANTSSFIATGACANAGRGCMLPQGQNIFHETGHSNGLHHSGKWNGTNVVGPGSDINYGNPYSVMGGAQNTNRGQPITAWDKHYAGWLPDANVATATASGGTYRIYQSDASSLDPGKSYALRIKKDYREYWVEYLPQFNGTALNGVLVLWSPWSASFLRDSLLEKLDIGNTLSDPEANIDITPVTAGGSSPQWIDVQVTIGAPHSLPPGTAPTISSIADVTTPEGIRVAFPITISASNLMLTQISSNEQLVKPENINFHLSGTTPTLSLLPEPQKSGTSTITVKASDGYRAATTSFKITVTPVNDAPFAHGQNAVTLAPSSSTSIVLDATDADGDALSYSIVTPPAHGTLTGTAPRVTYTPNVGFTGSDSFSFKANDGHVDGNVAPVTIVVTGQPSTNPPPAAPANLTASAASSSTIALSWSDRSTNETGFKIERKTGAAGTYTQITITGPNATNYQDAGLSSSTTYVYRVRATSGAGDSAYSNDASATTQAVAPPPAPVNQPPVVNAGPDQHVALPATATMAGHVSDDGLPNPPGAVTSTWSKINGPGSVTFTPDAHALSATASFSIAGTYLLRLTADDGGLSAYDDMLITVDAPVPPVPPTPNQPPTVAITAPANQATFTAPATIALRASASDPDGSVVKVEFFQGTTKLGDDNVAPYQYDWANVAAGSYTLTAKATDTSGASTISAPVTVIVQAAPTPPPPVTNHPPVVNAGPNQTITLPAMASLTGTASDDGLPAGGTLTTIWSKVSGPGTVTFGNAAATATTASFSAAGTYVLQLSASDSLLSSSATVTVTVKAPGEPHEPPTPTPPPHHEPPPEPSPGHARNLPPQVSAGVRQILSGSLLPVSTILQGVVRDDGQPTPAQLTSTWSVVRAPGQVTFADAHQPSTSVTLSAAGEYTLKLTATDGQATSSMTVVIQVLSTRPVTNDRHSHLDIWAGNELRLAGSQLPVSTRLQAVLTKGPVDPITVTWRQVSGPGSATFADAHDLHALVTLPAIGTYVLEVTATDGKFTRSSAMRITVLGIGTNRR